MKDDQFEKLIEAIYVSVSLIILTIIVAVDVEMTLCGRGAYIEKVFMKKLLILPFLLLCGCGNSDNKTTQAQYLGGYELDERKHFMTGDFYSVSNALRFNAPPKRWKIVCDGHGHYCPAFGSATIDLIDLLAPDSSTIRSNKFEAIICAWRIQSIWDSPPALIVPKYSTNQWSDCGAK